MGWGRTLLLGDIGNRLDIGDVERDVAALRAEIARTSRIDVSQDEAIRRLSDENAQVKLVVAALVRMLVAKGAISREDLAAVAAAIDASDGRADGRYSGPVA